MKKVVALLLAAWLCAGCTRVLVHGKDRPADPLEKTFRNAPTETFDGAVKALEMLGYKIETTDPKRQIVKSGWLSTRANSHYVTLFDREDYGTVGAYYRVIIQVEEESGKSLVTVSAPVRSLIGNIRSSYREEKRILRKMADLLRQEDFTMTNIGVSE